MKLKSKRLYLDFPWKSWKDHTIHIKNKKLKDAILDLCSRDRAFIFSYVRDKDVCYLTPEDINEYLRGLWCEVVSAKDFRSWHASAIVFLNFVDKITSQTSEHRRKKIILESFDQASEKLWNTRTMIKESYAHEDTVESVRDKTFRKIYNTIKDTKKLRNLTKTESQFLNFLKRLYEENISFE